MRHQNKGRKLGRNSAQRRALFQTPDDGVLGAGSFVGHLGGFSHGVRQIAVLPVLYDAILLLISLAARRQQASHRRQQQ